MVLRALAVIWILFVTFIAGVAAERLSFSAEREALVMDLEARKAHLMQRLMELEK